MCDICGRSSCANWMHSPEEQDANSEVIEAAEKVRELRREVRDKTE